jgi:hypothetical protein
VDSGNHILESHIQRILYSACHICIFSDDVHGEKNDFRGTRLHSQIFLTTATPSLQLFQEAV